MNRANANLKSNVYIPGYGTEHIPYKHSRLHIHAYNGRRFCATETLVNLRSEEDTPYIKHRSQLGAIGHDYISPCDA